MAHEIGRKILAGALMLLSLAFAYCGLWIGAIFGGALTLFVAFASDFKFFGDEEEEPEDEGS